MAVLDERFLADLEVVFDREWIVVAHVDQLAEAGDFVTRSVGTEPIVVLRNATGELRAHLNVCRHRGSQILRGEGRVKALKCPYHGWMYSLDGELRGAPEMKYSACFDKADWGLIGLAVAEWSGLVLVNFDREAELGRERLEAESGSLAGSLPVPGGVEIEEREVATGWREALEGLRAESPEAAVIAPNLVLLGGNEFAYVLPLDAGSSLVGLGHSAEGSP